MKELLIRVRETYTITVTDEEYEILMEGNDRPTTVEECKVKEDIVQKHLLERKQEECFPRTFDNSYRLTVEHPETGEELVQIF